MQTSGARAQQVAAPRRVMIESDGRWSKGESADGANSLGLELAFQRFRGAAN
jgi:hypothetical protein